jgi:FAD-linked oxidoreductase
MNHISNWSGSVKFNPQTCFSPKTESELQDFLAAKKTGSVRVMGSGHSFGPLIETKDTLINLDDLQGIINYEESSGDISFWGGTKLWKLNELLFEKGRNLENLGDIDRQSIAGTLSTGTHGTGIGLGTVSTQAKELTLILANGEKLILTPDHEYFKAAQVSLGALGVMTQVKLKSLPAYCLSLVAKRELLSDCLTQLPELAKNNRHFEFFYFPYSQYAQAKYANISTGPSQKKGFGTWINDYVVENLAFKALSELSRWIPGLTVPVSKLCGAAIGTVNKTHWAHEVFSTPRMVKFQEMEFSVDVARMADTVRELSAMIEKKKIRVHFPIECRTVKGDDVWLSPAYGRDSGYIAVHMYKGMEFREYFDAAQSIFLNNGGRPHWGKMHFLGARELSKLYPKWDEFQVVREKLDPQQLLMNSFLKKIFLGA